MGKDEGKGVEGQGARLLPVLGQAMSFADLFIGIS